MSGCAVCIYDLYLESKQAYRTALASALAKLEQMHVPRDTWPQELRDRRSSPAASVASSSGAPGAPSLQDGLPVDEEDLAMTASMSAFMEFEKRLKRSSPSAAPLSSPSSSS
jgi:Oxidoreductase-like protein, N-terminal